MAAPERAGPSKLGLALACSALTGVFLLISFPYGPLADRLTRELEAASGARLRFAEVGPALSWGGPVIEWREIGIVLPDGTELPFDLLRARPALSFSWLAGDPALWVELAGPSGRAEGVATVTAPPAFEGSLADVDLAALPTASFWPAATLSGTLSAELALTAIAPIPRGTVEIEARGGNFAAGQLQLALPFETLEGELVLGEDPRLELRSLRVDGPLFHARAQGSVGASDRFAAAPLEIEVELEPQPAFLPLLRQIGAAPGAGAATLQIVGTPDDPRVQ